MREMELESIQPVDAPPPPPVYRELTDSDSVTAVLDEPSRVPGLRSVVLLSGSVWVSGFRAAVQRSLLDLPVTRQQTLLELWLQRVQDAARELSQPDLPLRVLVTHGFPSPLSAVAHPSISIERDAVEYRGTGGALRDLTQAEPPDGYILVAHAAQLPLIPLAPIVRRLAGLGAELGIFTHLDGTPGRFMLIRCGCLRILPRIGFVDLMEQGLRVIGHEHSVRAVHSPNPFSLPVRTVNGYITALQRFHWQLRQGPQSGLGDEWQSSFSLVEPSAEVHPSACVHDAVVLRGARVERGAVIARSVVCTGARVASGQTVVDQLITL